MDALRHLVANIPDWLKRLDDLTDQIEQRQVELAQVSESSSGSSASAARSLRNRGSTESLKPKDEPEAHPTDPNPDAPTPQAAETPTTPPTTGAADPPPPSSPSGSNTPSALARQTNQVKAQAQARARATLRKRQRTDSVASAEGAAPKYRTRSLIIVYYDSYVQSFFEELVKFVSASRNMMRKAKMAAKVAQIKRLAEMEMDDDDEEDATSSTLVAAVPSGSGLQVDSAILAASGSVPNAALEVASGDEEPQTLRYVSTRRMQPVSRTPNTFMTATGRPIYPRAAAPAGARGTPNKQPDVYDELDKGLEYVQSMCEHAAHQFLRDGDCGEEVANIQRRLGETKELADKEMDRVKREEPETLSSSQETKGRSFRPHSMRRDHTGNPPGKDGTSKLEVDDAMDGVDDEEMEPPKLVYKSTRMMR
ncbi:hypothetical protein CONLIGDRAFT_644585 [Coniochaeta ligniaria NRRL 30616]|uniref:Uncharacterized protein n=1 Tax=Coniochaeta ligniaria NRRL 30616 TaxID=1408157 RepID=A0A1J7J519_9PEZI|nr:hypothetical protein CONLIGDRAFT_644585 [Coniochaeta ligniaria NRRL 30616]